ncbi:restriction endonuclease subunit S [Streptomyces hirsutus]|uniref:restriction endonuclease subunit S n=1 Tax=Streptomyces hirsutus TaxID=35620 RepID=UPI00331FF8D1
MTKIIASNFPITSLRRFVQELTDGPFGSALTSSHYTDQGARVIRLGNIGSARFRHADEAYISLDYFHQLQRHRVLAGDLIIAGLGDTNHPVGRACLTPEGLGPAIVKADCFRARLDEGRLLHRYAAWTLSSSVVSQQIRTLTRGTTRTRINLDIVREIQLPVPHIETQRRIADFLDAETTQIDRLVSLRNRQLQLAEEKRGSALDAAFRRHEHRPTRLKYLLRSRPRYGVLVPQFVDRGIRFIRVNDLLDLPGRANSLRQIPMELSAQYSRTATQPGDVLLSVVGTMGRSAIVPPELEGANVARAVASLRPNLDVPAELISIWLTTPEFMRQAADATSSDTAQPTLGMEDLSNFELSWPESAVDLAKLLHTVRGSQQHYRDLTRVFHAQSRLLLERRQALISAAVTGQFDVTTASGRNVTEGVSV